MIHACLVLALAGFVVYFIGQRSQSQRMAVCGIALSVLAIMVAALAEMLK